MARAKSRKRPCAICRKWFLPKSKHQKRQKTCLDPKCRKELHRRQCAAYNKRNLL